MHSVIQKLADCFGVKLSDRNCGDGYVFDGKSIAIQGLKWIDSEEINSQFIDKMISISLTDHDLLHEIAHYVCADLCQRDLPEYGLGGIPMFNNIYVEEVVDYSEQCIQECMVQLLCVHWGKAYGISPRLTHDPKYTITNSWDQYLMAKLLERHVPNNELCLWTALIRLRERGLLSYLPV